MTTKKYYLLQACCESASRGKMPTRQCREQQKDVDTHE